MSRRKFKDGERVHFKTDKLIYNGTVISYNGSLKKPYLVKSGIISFKSKYKNYRLRVEDIRKGWIDE